MVDLEIFKKLTEALYERLVNYDLRRKLKYESELYQTVRNAFNKFSKQFPLILTRESNDFEYVEREINGRKLYLLGEMHGSITQVDFVHENLVPKITENPKRWLMLLEFASMKSGLLSLSHFYLEKLAKLFGIPCEEALADLYARDSITYIKNYIQKVDPSLEAKKIDKIVLLSVHFPLYFQKALLSYLVENGFVTEKKAQKIFSKTCSRFVSRFSKNSGMPEPYVYTLLIELALNNFPETQRQFEEFVVKPWNELSKERFYKLLEKYSDKSEILVSVGIGHLPAFQ